MENKIVSGKTIPYLFAISHHASDDRCFAAITKGRKLYYVFIPFLINKNCIGLEARPESLP